MIPMNEINIGDMFTNPLHKGLGKYSGLLWRVEDKNEKEKMVKLQAYKFSDHSLFSNPIWKKNTDRMISEDWVYCRVPITNKDKADTRLIAAAPELLAALRITTAILAARDIDRGGAKGDEKITLDKLASDNVQMKTVLDNARAAIALAEGRP